MVLIQDHNHFEYEIETSQGLVKTFLIKNFQLQLI